jgi:hypothetical protein
MRFHGNETSMLALSILRVMTCFVSVQIHTKLQKLQVIHKLKPDNNLVQNIRSATNQHDYYRTENNISLITMK